MNMRKTFFYGVVAASFFCASCNYNSPEKPVIEEVTYENTYEMMLEYFATPADTPFSYVNDISGECVHMEPASRYGYVFPESHRGYRTSEGVEWWTNQVYSILWASGVTLTQLHATRIKGVVKNHGRQEGFEIQWSCTIWLNSDGGYLGSYKNGECDSATVWSYHTDTLTLPVTRTVNNQGYMSQYDVPGTYIHIVKGVGLYDFCLDGSSVWRRVE